MNHLLIFVLNCIVIQNYIQHEEILFLYKLNQKKNWEFHVTTEQLGYNITLAVTHHSTTSQNWNVHEILLIKHAQK